MTRSNGIGGTVSKEILKEILKNGGQNNMSELTEAERREKTLRYIRHGITMADRWKMIKKHRNRFIWSFFGGVGIGVAITITTLMTGL